MSREARVQGGMSIRKTTNSVIVIDHKPAYNSFTADIDAANGPAPGTSSNASFGPVVITK